MTFADNPRAVIGGNEAPDYAQRVTEQMARDYQELVNTLDRILQEAREAPSEVNTDEAALANGAIIKRFRDLDARLELARVNEKEPYLRGGEAVDTFFFGKRDKIGRRNKRDKSAKPGAIDILESRNQDFLDRKLAEEQARRAREAEQARRDEETRRAEADRLEREAELRRQEAERARKPEHIEQKTAVADKVEEQASIAGAAATVATERAQDTHIATLAKPADMVRTRGDDGVTLTMKKEPFAILVDDSKLDKDKLWPFIPMAAKEQALRAWAKMGGHNQQMAGAEIGHRNKGVTR